MHRPGVEPAISRPQVQRPNHYTNQLDFGGDPTNDPFPVLPNLISLNNVKKHVGIVHSAFRLTWSPECCICMFSDTTLSGCFSYPDIGIYFWTAGQRIDPARDSPFIWRVKSTDTHSETVSPMSYTNWGGGQPSYLYLNRIQACMLLWGGRSYTWDDVECSCEQPGSPGFRSVFRTASYPRNHIIQHLVHEAFRHRGQLRRKGFP